MHTQVWLGLGRLGQVTRRGYRKYMGQIIIRRASYTYNYEAPAAERRGAGRRRATEFRDTAR